MLKEKEPRWRVGARKSVVEQLDEHRWRMRIPRFQLTERIFAVALKLLEPNEAGSTEFEKLERRLFPGRRTPR